MVPASLGVWRGGGGGIVPPKCFKSLKFWPIGGIFFVCLSKYFTWFTWQCAECILATKIFFLLSILFFQESGKSCKEEKKVRPPPPMNRCHMPMPARNRSYEGITDVLQPKCYFAIPINILLNKSLNWFEKPKVFELLDFASKSRTSFNRFYTQFLFNKK